MLKVSMHASSLADASQFNKVAWLDIGYDRLAAIADYKAVMFIGGKGASPVSYLQNYPRWSASLWDLVARMIARCLHANIEQGEEPIGKIEELAKKFAFAETLCAVLEHFPGGDDTRRSQLGTVEIKQLKRGVYEARFTEDTFKSATLAPFVFRPKILNPAELVMRAAFLHTSGQCEEVPVRPALCIPQQIKLNDLSYVPLSTLVNPARTGFTRWLLERSQEPEAHPADPIGLAPAPLYAVFLKEAV